MLPPIDLSLYLVLDPTLCGSARGMVDTARIAAANGATVVQLRAPEWSDAQYAECSRALLRVLAPFRIPLIINDRVDVAVAIDAHGVHVGQTDMPPQEVRERIGFKKYLGLSVSNIEQMRTVPVNFVDHLGVGPVYSTATKPNAAAALGYDGMRTLIDMAPLPVVAIGGVKAKDVVPLRQMGANGIAVVSAICGQADVATATWHLAQLSAGFGSEKSVLK